VVTDAKAMERGPDRLEAGRDYTRNVTVQVPPHAVGTIGMQAERIRQELGETYAEHEITGYELCVRVFVTAGGETDAGGEPAGDNVA
jgi:hypothetical protein